MIRSQLESKIDYTFQNETLLKEALTHRSYLNENPSWKINHNERLEFLGDAVLELVSTEELFNRYPEEDEGKLTSLRAALVNYQMLAAIAREIKLEEHLLLSRGEAKENGRAREVILANALEALIGAIYLDGTYLEAKKFIKNTVLIHLEKVIRQKLYKDPKSQLQEIVQAQMKITPSYKILGETGPEHEKIFQVGVYIGDRQLADGNGLSKQEAELDAARKALLLLDEKKINL